MGFGTTKPLREAKVVSNPRPALRKLINVFLEKYGCRVLSTRKGTQERTERGRYYCVYDDGLVKNINVDLFFWAQSLLNLNDPYKKSRQQKARR